VNENPKGGRREVTGEKKSVVRATKEGSQLTLSYPIAAEYDLSDFDVVYL
jgi:hypothetical protein